MVFSIALICIFLAFTLSASAGLGGSLILVPAMALMFGPKAGIAIAALLLACNNVGKVIGYYRTIPVKAAMGVVLLTVLGTTVGSRMLVATPELLVDYVIICSILATFLTEHRASWIFRRVSVHVLALLAGCVSGFSGTSGPLKGLALRNLDLKRYYFVGAASAVSLAGDASKAVVFFHAKLLTVNEWVILKWAIPLIPIAVLVGRQINQRIGERAFKGLFWTVMVGYAGRLILA